MNYTVKAAARATGISESRLRTWERRYGIPSPGRSANGRRRYDDSDLSVIRRMTALVDGGLSAADAAEAVRSGEEVPGGASELVAENALVAALVLAAESFDEKAFIESLSDGIREMGWATALDELLFPVLRRIGAGWEEAVIAPAKEHFASELVKRHIAAALADVGPSSAEPPRVILACPEGERHDLGLLALCLLLRAAGVNIVFLGADVPTTDLIEAHTALAPEAICLSATSANGLASLVRASRTLAARRGVRLFIGGPAISPEGAMAAGTRLPPSVGDAARVITSALAGGTGRGE